MTSFTHVLGCPCAKCVDDKLAAVETLMQPEKSADKYGFHDYPIPSHAAHIWKDEKNLYLGLPPKAEDGRGHVLVIPLSRCEFSYSGWGTITAGQTGWKQLLEMLSARDEDSAARQPSPIGTKGAPVQYDLDQVLKTMTIKKKPEKKPLPPGFTLADLGL